MAAFSTRINLLPTSRTLASGVPFAPRIALVHPPASHGHGHGGPRSDVPPKWTGSQGGFASNSRINSKSRQIQDDVRRWIELGGRTDRVSIGLEWMRELLLLCRQLTNSPSYRYLPAAILLLHPIPPNRGSVSSWRCPRLVRIPVFGQGRKHPNSVVLHGWIARCSSCFRCQVDRQRYPQ
jgi:hypothetical protein